MNKKINIGFLSLFLIISSLSLVSAVATINTPAASTTLNACSTLQTFNVSSTDGVVPNRVVNLTFYAQSTLTANSTWVTLGTNNSLNLTLLANETITSINITRLSLEDANNYIINVTVMNQTGSIIGSDTNTGMTVDCTVPAAPTSLTPTSDTDGSVTFSGTVTGSQTTSCTLRFNGALPPGGQGQTMTHTGGTCSLTIASIPEMIYTWFIRASDETNTTDSSTQQTNVDITTSAGKAATYIAEGAKAEGGAVFSVVNGNGILGGLTGAQIGIGLGIILLIVFLVARYKK